MIVRQFLILLSALLGLLSPLTALAFGVGLTPSTVELEVRPGSHHRQILRVKNFNPNKSIRLTASVADWILDEHGEVVLAPPDELGQSASSWITFSPSVLLLEPNTSRDIVVDISTPFNLSHRGDHRTAILLSTVLPTKKEREGKQGVWNKYQIASLFYANVDSASSKPVITAASLQPNDAQTDYIVNIDIENQGERHARLDGFISISSFNSGKEVSKTPFYGVLMDRQKRQFSVNLGELSLAPGEYQLGFNIIDQGKPVPSKLETRPRVTIH